MTREEIYQGFYDTDVRRGFLHSHSYTGNPLACRAAMATLEIFRSDDVLVQNRLKAERLTQALQGVAQHEKVRHFRQQGMIWAFDAILEDQNAAKNFQRKFLPRP